jgi:hypothetical protein
MNTINICDSFKTNPDGSDDVPNLLNMKEINKAHYDRIKKRNVENNQNNTGIYNTPVCYMWMIPTRTTNMLTTTASKLIVIILSTKII